METNADSSPSTPETPNNQESTDFLYSLLNKNLRVTTRDSRMFWGGFKCTDSDSNIVLKHTYEYRHPSLQRQAEEIAAAGGTVKMDMTSRYLGLVVVPGQYITKIEVEEFASQMRKPPPPPPLPPPQTAGPAQESKSEGEGEVPTVVSPLPLSLTSSCVPGSVFESSESGMRS